MDLITALITPFNDDNSIDFSSFKTMLDLQVKSKIKAIILGGSTGEGRLMTTEEKISIFEYITKNFATLDIIVSINTDSYDQLQKDIESYRDCGISHILVAPPSYIKPMQSAILSMFEKIDTYGIKVMIYNIPTRSAVNIETDTINKILETCNNITSIKDSNPATVIDNIINTKNRDVGVFCGNDISAVADCVYGASGLVSVASNIIPQAMHDMILSIRHNIPHSSRLFKTILPVIKALEQHNPIAVKLIAHDLGLIQNGKCRPPLNVHDIQAGDIHRTVQYIRNNNLS